MNKFRLLAIALVFGTTSLFASTIITPDVSKDEIRKQIIELVANSDTVIENQVVVNVKFTFNTQGEIVVLKVNSKDKQVLSFIRQNLNNKSLENPGKPNREYTMDINIK
jgi:DNA-binding NarL/FixJ family response regulator